MPAWVWRDVRSVFLVFFWCRVKGTDSESSQHVQQMRKGRVRALHTRCLTAVISARFALLMLPDHLAIVGLSFIFAPERMSRSRHTDSFASEPRDNEATNGPP